MLRASRRSLRNCHLSKQADTASTPASTSKGSPQDVANTKPASSFARKPRRSSKSLSNSHNEHAKVPPSLPKVPVLAAAPRTVRLDSFFAGSKPLLEIEVHPQDRVERPPVDAASQQPDTLVDYEGSIVGQPDHALNSDVKEHLAAQTPFRPPPPQRRPSARGQRSTTSQLKALQHHLLPQAYHQPAQEAVSTLSSPFTAVHLAASFLDKAHARLQPPSTSALASWLAAGAAHFQPDPPQTLRIAPRASEGSGSSEAPAAAAAAADPVVEAVTQAFAKMWAASSARPFKVLSVRPLGPKTGGGQGVVVAFATEEAPAGAAQPAPEILHTVSDLLKQSALAEDGLGPPSEDAQAADEGAGAHEAAFYVYDPPARYRVSLGPRPLARRGGRAVPRINLRQLVTRLDSVKRKRKTKMTKHKYKKRRKATRAQRKKLGK